jgi:hypothetical protein
MFTAKFLGKKFSTSLVPKRGCSEGILQSRKLTIMITAIGTSAFLGIIGSVLGFAEGCNAHAIHSMDMSLGGLLGWGIFFGVGYGLVGVFYPITFPVIAYMHYVPHKE